jgi:hypothetical protein
VAAVVEAEPLEHGGSTGSFGDEVAEGAGDGVGHDVLLFPPVASLASISIER